MPRQTREPRLAARAEAVEGALVHHRIDHRSRPEGGHEIRTHMGWEHMSLREAEMFCLGLAVGEGEQQSLADQLEREVQLRRHAQKAFLDVAVRNLPVRNGETREEGDA